MGMLHRARKVPSDLLRRDRFEREMDEEVLTFLDMDARDRERAGASPAEARRAARARFGGVEASKEYARDGRFGAWLESVRRDVVLAARLLARRPAFSAAAVLTIALGALPVAVTAAMANWIFFAPAPGVTGADRLVRVEIVTRDEEGDTERAELSFAEHAVLRRAVRSFDGFAGHRGSSTSVSVPGVDALHVDYTAVSYDYFEVLGMRIAAGRSFTPEEDRPAANATVAVLGYDLAEALFGDPRGAPGRRVLVHGLDFMVVGVAPPDFRGLKNDHDPRLFLPGAAPSSNLAASRVAAPRFEEFMARLAGDVEVERARAELTAAVRSLAAAGLPESDRFRTASVVVERQPGMSFSSRNTHGEVVFMVSMIATAGTLLLVLAGANLGNLLLFRVARRREETALRRALGASRWRLVRAHLIDVTLLTLAGGGVALLCIFWLGAAFGGVGIPEACAKPVKNASYRSPVSRRTMVRNAALASSVVASIPSVWPLSRPASATRCKIQVNTVRCVSRSINRRVREIVE